MKKNYEIPIRLATGICTFENQLLISKIKISKHYNSLKSNFCSNHIMPIATHWQQYNLQVIHYDTVFDSYFSSGTTSALYNGHFITRLASAIMTFHHTQMR